MFEEGFRKSSKPFGNNSTESRKHILLSTDYIEARLKQSAERSKFMF